MKILVTGVRTLKQNIDKRGVFTELFRSDKIGEFKQVNVGTIKPGYDRGGHYHKLRKEWFCIIQGKCLYQIENILNKQRSEFLLSGNKIQQIEIAPMNYHKIINIGDEDVVFVYAISTLYNKKDSDTFKL